MTCWRASLGVRVFFACRCFFVAGVGRHFFCRGCGARCGGALFVAAGAVGARSFLFAAGAVGARFVFCCGCGGVLLLFSLYFHMKTSLFSVI